MDEAAKDKLQRMGILSGIAIALHNIPSGIATFTAEIEDPAIGASMAISVGLHNIAEGIAIAAPVCFATGSKRKAVMWCVIAAMPNTSELSSPLLLWAATATILVKRFFVVLSQE
ncbi:unnamed protein product [Peronospora belbahrii]|uniref:Zinc transporter n=1 Tax=Peronospora belbahrii TaxID=622444 RepID=A0ABN8CZU3_9STRA|nr:unnamed protein product [Peronospora belbahrii]